MQVQLSERAQRVLSRLLPAVDFASCIEAVTWDALRLRRRELLDLIREL